MLVELKKEVLQANLELINKKLVIYTWGNVSGICRERGLVVIKPSGVPYEELTLDLMVVLDLEGNVMEGDLRPSSDVSTHLEIYKGFSEIGGVVHTHSTWATSWAQAKRSIPCFGTTHADYFYRDIPCTRGLTDKEITGDYEVNTGKVIVETFLKRNYNHTPGVLVAEHGPFTWGIDPGDAVYNGVVLEELAKLAFNTITIDESASSISESLLNKHFFRKHGENAYYGQD